MIKRFCPKCGTGKGPFIMSFCKKCYLEDYPAAKVSPQIALQSCKHCGKILWKGKWRMSDNQILRSLVESNVSASNALQNPKIIVDFSPGDDEATEFQNQEILKFAKSHDFATVEVHVNGILGDTPVSEIFKTVIVQKQAQCDSCMKLSSSYHEAVLQLRYGRDPGQTERSAVAEKVGALLAAESRKVALSGISGIKNIGKGIDFMIGSKHAAKFVAKKLAAANNSKITRSFTLVGVERSGKPKKRFTFCVRMK